MGNPVVHFEIRGRDAQRLQDFYAQAFGWKIQEMEGGYRLVDSETPGTGINGGLVGEADRGVVIYVSVDDPRAHLEKVQALGARVVTDVTVMPGVVTFAEFEDPEGNLVGIVASEPPPAEPR